MPKIVERQKYNCTTCKKEIYRLASQHKGGNTYCSQPCRKTKQEKSCPICGKKFQVILSRAIGPRYCSRKCHSVSRVGSLPWNKGKTGIFSGDKNPRWNGGRKTHAYGYQLVASPNHPLKDKQGYVREHRLVMEKHLGRYLRPEEDVHHLDHDKKNNDITNLELFSSRSEHLKKHHREGGRTGWFKEGHKNEPRKQYGY